MRKRTTIVIIIFFVCIFSLQAKENKYDIQVELSPDMKTANCTQTVTYYNPNHFSLKILYFRVHDPGDKAQCTVKEITNEKGQILEFDSSRTYPGVLAVRLLQSLKKGKSINLNMSFSVPVEYRSYYIFGYLSNYHCWHPWALPYYQGELKPNWKEFASYRITLTVPEDKKIVTSGKLISETPLSDGTKKLTAEASHVTNYGIFFFDQLHTEKRQVQDITVYNHFIPDSADWTRGLADKAAEIVQFYIDTVGFYPQKEIHIIPGSFTFGGGFPIASNVFEIHQHGGKDKTGITAHEIAHIYWGYDYILVPKQNDHHWLHIGMGIYTDHFYRGGEPPYGGDYLAAAYAGFNTQMMQSEEEFAKLDYDWNSVICHNKAFAVMKMLEYVIGKKIFHRVYTTLLQRYGYQVLTVDDFIKVTEEISGQDLKWFFHPWLHTNRILDYQIRNVETGPSEKGFLTKVQIERTGEIPMPVEIELMTTDSILHIKTFPREREEGCIEFTTTSPLLNVELDPNYRLTIFSRIHDPRRDNYVIMLYEKGEYQRCLDFSERVLYSNPGDIYTKYFRGMAYKELGRFREAQETFREIMSVQDNAWLHIQLGYIYDLQNFREKACEEYQKTLELPDFLGSKKEAKKRLDEPYRDIDQ